MSRSSVLKLYFYFCSCPETEQAGISTNVSYLNFGGSLQESQPGYRLSKVFYDFPQSFGVNTSMILQLGSPQRCLYLVVVVWLVRLYDPESNADGSLTTSRATHAGKVKG
jgi:hypothetical protein